MKKKPPKGPDLFGYVPPKPPLVPSPSPEKAFNGPAYVPAEDHARLRGQLLRIFNYMKDGTKRTLDEIESATGDPQASISAQLRHLRKKKYGSHQMIRTKAPQGHGLCLYQVIVNEGEDE